MRSWESFKGTFNLYAKNTSGLFSIFDTNSLCYFKLDYFLEKCDIMNEKPFSLTQIEMLMALSTFIEIQEVNGTLEFEIFPVKIIRIMRSLIEKNILRLHPRSLVKQRCLNYGPFHNTSCSLAAAA